jgi:large conductance mechanosensitive channel
MGQIELSAGVGKAKAAAQHWAGDFRAFLTKNSVLGLAIGVVIGGAVGKVVSGIVDDVIMPVIGVLLPGGEWRNAQLVLSGTNALKYGDLMGRIVDFLIVSSVVFVIIRSFVERSKPAEAPAAPTKACPECLETVPAGARKCRACCSTL